jgi:chromosome segregation ATPase
LEHAVESSKTRIAELEEENKSLVQHKTKAWRRVDEAEEKALQALRELAKVKEELSKVKRELEKGKRKGVKKEEVELKKESKKGELKKGVSKKLYSSMQPRRSTR